MNLSAAVPLPSQDRPDDGWAAETRFWLCQEPYVPYHAAHQRSRWTTRVQFRLVASEWRIHFDCHAAALAPSPPLKPVGDPDIWKAEYVQVLMPEGAAGGCIHLSVTRSGQAISERHDKRRDPIAGWRGEAAETRDGWRATIAIPLAGLQRPWRIRLARWVPEEGLTRWPTPFGSWWQVVPEDFLEVQIGAEGAGPTAEAIQDFIRLRERTIFEQAGTAPDAGGKVHVFLDQPPGAADGFLRRIQARVRTQPWLSFDRLPPADLSRCQTMLQNRFWFLDTAVQMTTPLDWDAHHGRFFDLLHVTRFDFLADMVAAWRETGDSAYARKAMECIETWLEKQDLRQFLTPGRYPVRWSWLNLPHRMVCIMRTVFSLIETGLVSEELLIRLYKATAETLWSMDSGNTIRHYHKNHSIIIADHGVQLSILCAELRESERMRGVFFEHFRRALQTQFLPDGVQWELSTSYHMICYQRLTEATSLCESAGIAVPPDITDWRRRILTVAARYLLPNGEVANFNDGSREGTADAIGRPDDTFVSIILREGPGLGAEEALALATHGRQGRLAPPFSHAMPYAGHFILRDGLARASMALAFDAGPLGMGHAHEDALTITLACYGKTLLADLGSGAYDERCPMRRYSISTAAHSTICVDGQPQASAAFPDTWRRQTPLEGQHCFGERVQFATGCYRLGYGEKGSIRVEHRRAVLFVNRAFVVVIDYLHGTGEHLIESRFVLDALPYAETATGLRTTTGTGDLDIQLAFPGDVEKEVACGQETPFAGWVIRGLYGQAPSPRLTFLATQRLPACWVTLLTPFREIAGIPRVETEASGEEIRIRMLTSETHAALTCRRASPDLTFADERIRFEVTSDLAGRLRFRETPR